MMVKVSIEREFDSPAEVLWAMLADFGDISWIPGIDSVELEGEGVGMIRYVTTAGLPTLAERMEAIDHQQMILDYSIPSVAYMQVKNYSARAQVSDLGDRRCRLHWTCECEADGIEEALATANTEGFYEMIMQWVGDYLEKKKEKSA
jgi:carbon monoxide dehydrogenase subunit G